MSQNIYVQTNYVAAFAIDDFNNVLLIEKKRPEWQAGYLNGVGGKIKYTETVREAMTREFKEETDIYINKHNWIYVCELVNSVTDNSKVTFFAIKIPTINFKQTTDEKLVLVNTCEMDKYILIPNLKALIELAKLRLNYNNSIFCGSISF